jgi:hypothetical protein
MNDVPVDDRFGLWYRFRSLAVYNLLYLAGPAQLDGDADPRSAVEKDYERRRDLHRARLGKPPVVKAPPTTGGLDVVVLCAAGGVLALVVLLVWAVLTAR